MLKKLISCSILFFAFAAVAWAAENPGKEIVAFKNDKLPLHGILYKPQGNGPFPAIIYNHGSAPGMLNNKVSGLLGPMFANRGWVFFMPYRRGQGLSADAGPYIMDEVEAARKKGGLKAAAETMAHLLKTDHLSDQLAALDWLRQASFVQKNRIAVFGNSFGGIETVLGAEHGKYCAAVDASGGAMSWDSAPVLQALMIEAVRHSKAPIFFYQAENDFSLAPSKTLSAAMKEAHKTYELKFYPPYGKSDEEGHSFAYLGSSIWAEDVMSFLDRYCRK